MLTVDLTKVEPAEGWTRREIAGACVLEAHDPAADLVVPIDATGPHTLHLKFFTRARQRDLAMQLKLSSQRVWKRVRPMRFIFDDRDAIQSSEIAIDVKPGDSLHIRTEPVSSIAISEVALAPAEPVTSTSGDRFVAFIHDTNMSFSKFTVKVPEDVYSILEPYVDSHVTHVFWGTGVGTYSPLYDSKVFGWHGAEQKEFMADHRERTAGVMRTLMKAGKDPLALALEYARANGLQLWANHRISKNHEPDFRDDFPGGRYLLKHRDKLVLGYDGQPHFQTIMSFAFPEIRRTAVQCLVEQARYGVDGLYIDFSRKSPIAGWEEPSVQDFKDEHGFDPKGERPDGFSQMWHGHLCKYPTLFLRELREALVPVERELGHRMPVAAYVRGGWRFTSGLPACIGDGLDPFAWAEEGLVDILVPGHDLWMEQECLDRYFNALKDTRCRVWGAIGPQTREVHRSVAEREEYGQEYADVDPWRYLQAAHDYYSQGVPGVTMWEAQDIPSVPQVWNVIKHRIGSHAELCRTFGNKLGRFDGSDKFERHFVD